MFDPYICAVIILILNSGKVFRTSEIISDSSMSASRALLSSSRLMVVPRRGKALVNWARPSIDEMGVPTEPWKQVRISL